MTTKKLLGISALILTLLALTVIGGVIVWALSWEHPVDVGAQEEYWSARTAEIQEHSKAWNEQNIVKYQIGIRLTYTSECKREVTIENNVVTQTTRDNCEEMPLASLKTVDDLFAFIKTVVDAKGCGSNGCECDGPLVMNVIYDQQYKFPQLAKPVSHREEIWRFKREKLISFGENFLYGNTCAVSFDAGTEWEIYSFAPLN